MTQADVGAHCQSSVDVEEHESNRQFIAIAAISGVLLFLGLILEFRFSQVIYAHALYVIVIAIAGYRIFRNAFSALLQRRFEMNLLMSIAAVGAFLIGHAEEGASVIFLFFVAEFLEDYAAQRARSSVTALLKLAEYIFFLFHTDYKYRFIISKKIRNFK